MNARRISVLAGAYCVASGLLVTVAWGQSGTKPPAALDVNPIGKVLTVTGVAHIEHSSAVIVQANLTTGDAPAKIGDLVFRGDLVQTGPDGALSISFADGSSFTVSNNAKMEVNDLSTIQMAIQIRA